MHSIDGIHTLANAVIVDPIRVDLDSRIALFQRVFTMMATKERLYQDRYFAFGPLRYLGVYTNKSIMFFIDVLT